MSTIKDVAKIAGVSTATVSRVINHVPNVKPETVELVQKAIEECSFVPNFVARSLKSEQSKMIGMIVSDISNSYFAVMAKTLETQLRKKGYDMMICSTDDNPEIERKYINQLIGNQVSGIIINTTGKNNSLIEEVSNHTPMVMIERSIDSTKYKGDFVGANNIDGIYSLTRYLIDSGHRKIGIINGNMDVSTGVERYRGFQNAMHEIGVKVDESYTYQYNAHTFAERGGYEAGEFFYKLKEKPSAVVCTNNTMSIGMLKFFKEHKIQIPEQISVICYGDIENSELFFVEPTYTTLNPHTIGLKVFDYICSRIEKRNVQNRETIFESKLYEGGSVKNIAKN